MPKHNFTYGKANVKVYHANFNEGLPKHSHAYSHALVCNNGSCLVSLEGRSYTINKDNTPLSLPAAEWHEIAALEDNTVFLTIFAEGTY